MVRYFNLPWQTRHQITAIYHIGQMFTFRQNMHCTDSHFDFFRCSFSNQQIIIFLDKIHNGIVHFITAYTDGLTGNNTTQRDHRYISCPAADIHNHAAGRICYRQTGSNGSSHWFLHDVHFFCASLHGSLSYRPFFHRSRTGRHTDDHLWLRKKAR